MKKKYMLGCTVMVLAVGLMFCRKKPVYLTETQVASILTELYVLDAWVKRHISDEGSGRKLYFQQQALEIYTKHHTSLPAFEHSYQYYLQEPSKIEHIYALTHKELQLQHALKKKQEFRQYYL